MSIFEGNKIVVDPFAGNCDLLNLIDNEKMAFDLDPKTEGVEKRDSLLNPISYAGKYIFTNPPFLNKNKTKNKTIFNKYDTDDLYKASLLSIMDCDGGIVIVPLNFFSGEDKKIREKFLSNFRILNVNVFEEEVFDDTSYTVCCFSFIKEKNEKQQIKFNFFPNKKSIDIALTKDDGYTIGSEIYNLKKSNVNVKRLREGDLAPKSRIFLSAIDTGAKEGKINLELRNEPFYGKDTDRSFATIVFDRIFSEDEEELIVNKFNEKLDFFRDKYNSLFLSQYRNSTKEMARKRIGFKLAYTLISNIIYENLEYKK